MDLDAIWRRARNDLTVTTKEGDSDLFLWEHSARVAQSAQRIAAFPVVRAEKPNDNVVALAGLYHDAGWAVRCRNGEIDRSEVLLGPISESGCELAASLLESSLAGLAPAEVVERAARAVRALCEREPSLIETKIVLEARHLQEFGLLMLWPAIRRGLLDGKGVQAVIDTWRRKKEYHFWTARLKDSFRFQPVRDLAEQRLKKLEAFMQEIDAEHTNRDVPALKPDESIRRPTKSPSV